MLEEQTVPVRDSATLSVPKPVEFPLPVVPDWDARVKRADRLMRLIDRHLDYEAYGRCLLEAEEMTPMALCSEQRINLLTDVQAIVI